jgi:pre-rRNA-processing protein IPI3
MRALMATVSADRTCRTYDLASGTLLLNLVFQEALTAIVFDQLETTVFVGTSSGAINSFSTQSPPRQREYHMSAKDKVNNQFLGHTAAITCLAVSLDGETLMSGSADENVNIWNIQSKQMVRTLPHKGAVTNVLFMLAPKCMFEQEAKLTLLASNFQRQVREDTFENHTVEVFIAEEVDIRCGPQAAGNSVSDGGGNSSEIEKLRAEIVQLKQTNKELYDFGVQHILKS